LPEIVIVKLPDFVTHGTDQEAAEGKQGSKPQYFASFPRISAVAQPLLLDQPTLRALRGTHRDDEGRWREKP
jgi:hypothetical protein